MKPFIQSIPIALVAVLVQCCHGQNVDHAAIENYIVPDVTAVVYMDFEKWNLETLQDAAADLGVERFETVLDDSGAIAKNLSSLKAQGVTRGYVVIRLEEVVNGGLTIVFPVDKEHVSQEAIPAIKTFVNETAGLGIYVNRYQATEGVVQVSRDSSVIEPSKEQARKNLAEAWRALGNGSIGVIIFGDNETRRVWRELQSGPLPAPFQKLTGATVADDVAWAGMQLVFDKSIDFKLEIEASNQETAENVKQTLSDAMVALLNLPNVQSQMPEAAQAQIRTVFQPQREGSRVRIELGNQLGQLMAAISIPVQQMQRQAHISEHQNRIRQLLLAMHNHESATKSFPNPFGNTEQVPGELSWRVQILPFLGHMDLYRQFKLDEPWDSEHNQKLISKMPAEFQSPFVEDKALNEEGKTIFQLVVGKETAFDPNGERQPISFAKITDGTSNTIAIVSTDSENAQVWTRPADWEVDFEKPATGINGRGDSIFVGFFDGSVHRLPVTIENEKLKALLTIAGGEVVQTP